MARRKEKTVKFGSDREGITLTVTRQGLEVHGVFDSCAGIEGGAITWQELERMRRAVEAKGAQR